MENVIIAGANSFVASHFAYELLAQDYHVIALVRGNGTDNAEQRMRHALENTTLDGSHCTGELTVLDYSLRGDRFGLPEDTLKQMFSGNVDFFHFAASLKFDYRSKEEIFETNIDGLKNALDIFNRYSSNRARFFFISTAYSCGKFSEEFREEFYPEQEISAFRNYYEQSKRLAENIVKEYIDGYDINAHIIRLSQVVGNSQTGVTRTDYGIFDFAKRIRALSQEHPHQTIRIHADPDATQNLIAIDTVVYDLMNMVQKTEVPEIMNFVAEEPLKNREIIRSISDLLPVELIPEKDIDPEGMNKLEKLVLAGMSFTGNYIDTDIDFQTCQRDKVISPKHREVNESSVFAMLAYFLDNIMADHPVKTAP